MMYGGAGNGNTVKGFSNTYAPGKDPFSQTSPFQRGMFFITGQRRRMNIVAVLVALFVPWGLFAAVTALLSFHIHYKLPLLTQVLVFSAFVIVVGSSAYQAANAVKKKFLDPAYQPSWYIFIAVTSLAAFVLALFAGEWNYTYYMQPYYDLENLAAYKDVDTNDYQGQQLMDAGQIDFKKGTVLELSHSMGFKNHDIYCVAPIVTKGNGGSTAASTDFWAVGKNCCSGVAADFHCSGFSDPKATGVIRLMHDQDRAFYRLAVQQAEATYGILATHPLFFEWVRNAEEATEAFANTGYFNYFLCLCSHFAFQVFLVAVVALAFAKLIHA